MRSGFRVAGRTAAAVAGAATTKQAARSRRHLSNRGCSSTCSSTNPEQVDLRTLFALVDKGSVGKLRAFLEEHSTVDLNERQLNGVTLLIAGRYLHTFSAIQRGRKRIVSCLLSLPSERLDITDAAFHAVRSGNTEMVGLILDHLGSGFINQAKVDAEQAVCKDQRHFGVGVTPLVLAAMNDDIHMVRFLRARGACNTCAKQKQNGKSLESCLRRINVYTAISSPAYLCEADDPILEAFELSRDLEKCATVELEYTVEYQELRAKVNKFAADLLDHCRNREEVLRLLRRKEGVYVSSTSPMPRLRLALECGQKEFISHLNCQHVVSDLWMGRWADWIICSPRRKLGRICLHTLLFPLMAALQLVAPFLPMARSCSYPFARSLSSYVVFMIVLFYEAHTHHDGVENIRSQMDDPAKWYIALYVLGCVWADYKAIFKFGFRRYLNVWWHWFHLVEFSLYMLVFFCWYWSFVDVACFGFEEIDRRRWDMLDPALLAEGFFALACILSSCRAFYFLVPTKRFGPLLLSLGYCVAEVVKYLLLYVVMIAGFVCALACLYGPYEHEWHIDADGKKVRQSPMFTGYLRAFQSLFWMLFGFANPLEGGKIVLRRLGEEIVHHRFTEEIGFFILGLYNIVTVLVLINLMIAMMANKAAAIMQNADVEWKCNRMQFYAKFFEDDMALPSPLNLLPSFRWFTFFRKCCSPPDHLTVECNLWACCYMVENTKTDDDNHYTALVKDLVARYWWERRTTKIVCPRTNSRTDTSSQSHSTTASKTEHTLLTAGTPSQTRSL